jgi:transcription-repair coupling factor (superfamily II helicase)
LHTFGAQQVEPLAAWEGEEDIADATDEIRAERLKLVSRISQLASRQDEQELVVPASVQALCQPVPKREALEKSCLRLEINETMSPEDVVDWLAGNNFERVERIDLPGQFARRGGIVDIYAPLATEKVLYDKEKASASDESAEAVRVEFFGDTVESIREIDLDTHRSTERAFPEYPAPGFDNNS